MIKINDPYHTYLYIFLLPVMSVLISDIDDFVNPSQACIVVNSLASDSKTNKKGGGTSNKIKVDIDASISDDFTNIFPSTSSDSIVVPISTIPRKPDLLKTKKNKNNVEVATVSLSDCLACSGCVTSAESVLIEEHGYSKLLSKLADIQNASTLDAYEKHVEQVVVSISPQSLASFTLFLNNSSGNNGVDSCSPATATLTANVVPIVEQQVSVEEVYLRLSSLLKSIGVSYVIDTTAANEIVLLEAAEEFLFRHRQQLKNRVVRQSDIQSSAASGLELATASIPPGKGKFRNVKPKPPISNALSSTRVQWIEHKGSTTASREEEVGLVGTRAFDTDVHSIYPLLTSHCPGFICYAEKQQPEILSNISTVKSSQQIIGCVLKEYISNRAPAVLLPNSIPVLSDGDTMLHTDRNNSKSPMYYHVSVQPCFDKKLEASRKDFYHERGGVKEVDMVISTAELWNMLTYLAAEKDSMLSIWDYLHSFPCDSVEGVDGVERMLRGYFLDGKKTGTGLEAASEVDHHDRVSVSYLNSGSGGFIEFCARYSAYKLWGLDLWDQPLCYLPGSLSNKTKSTSIENTTTSDYCECILSNKRGVLRAEDTTDDVPTDPTEEYLVFVKAYGFRGIQSIATKIKRYNCYASHVIKNVTKLPVDFIEVMACPSGGCLNGGGQIKTSHKETAAEVNRRVLDTDSIYHTAISRKPLILNLGNLDVDKSCILRNPFTKFVYDMKPADMKPVDEAAISQPLLHTRYHAVPKLEILAPLAAKW